MKRKAKIALLTLGVVGLVSLWPVSTPVSGRTKIKIRNETDAPIAGVAVRQFWGVYGWGGFGGTAAGTTDAEGAIVFPPRKTIGLLGFRAFHRGSAFITQCTILIVYGGFPREFTERWGPITGFDIDLPNGTWLPATWAPGTRLDDLASPTFGDGPHRYVYLRNLDPSAPSAYVSGDALGFIGDVEVTLRLRRPTVEEAKIIQRAQAVQKQDGRRAGAQKPKPSPEATRSARGSS